MTDLDVIERPPCALYFDPENPRLVDKSFAIEDQEKILGWLLLNKSVN
ncbi:MAG: hypothetical protein OXM02_07450 [Bacteroidota bacterium]|nr:hypothetical protein [Bacteroidota bacterium]